MTTNKFLMFLLAAVLAGAMAGCSSESTRAADVEDSIEASLQQSGLKDVDVKQDRDKGVVTLTGNVASEADKLKAESIAKSKAGNQVVANQIAVRPPGNEGDARRATAALDDGIEENLKAALIKEKLNDKVNFDSENQVVTLKGDVNSAALRARVETLAAGIPNVRQVVNEIEVKGRKATTTR